MAELFRLYLAGVTDVDGAAGRAVTLVADAGDRIAGTARYYPPGKAHEVPELPGRLGVGSRGRRATRTRGAAGSRAR